MKAPLVMTIIGDDKPGLVDAVSRIVGEHGGNWLESRMAHLGGQFAGILRLEVSAERRDGLIDALRALEERGLTVVARPDEVSGASVSGRPATLELVGHDRPGIVRHISHALASHGANVEELTTESFSAPMTGEVLFRAKASLRLPREASLARLRADLENLAQELMVDLTLRDDRGKPPSDAEGTAKASST